MGHKYSVIQEGYILECGCIQTKVNRKYLYLKTHQQWFVENTRGASIAQNPPPYGF